MTSSDGVTSAGEMNRLEMILGVGFVALGIVGLIVWHTGADPSTVPETWRWYEAYSSLYQIIPMVSVGTVLVGILTALGPVLRTNEQDEVVDCG